MFPSSRSESPRHPVVMSPSVTACALSPCRLSVRGGPLWPSADLSAAVARVAPLWEVPCGARSAAAARRLMFQLVGDCGRMLREKTAANDAGRAAVFSDNSAGRGGTQIEATESLFRLPIIREIWPPPPPPPLAPPQSARRRNIRRRGAANAGGDVDMGLPPAGGRSRPAENGRLWAGLAVKRLGRLAEADFN